MGMNVQRNKPLGQTLCKVTCNMSLADLCIKIQSPGSQQNGEKVASSQQPKTKVKEYMEHKSSPAYVCSS